MPLRLLLAALLRPDEDEIEEGERRRRSGAGRKHSLEFLLRRPREPLERVCAPSCEDAALDRVPRGGGQIEHEAQIMQAEQAETEDLLLVDEVADVRAREPACTPGRRSGSSSGRGSRAKRALRRFSRPSHVSALPVRAVRVGSTQSNMSTPARDHLDHAFRVADAHEVARPVRRGAAAAAAVVAANIAARSSPTERPPIA